MQHKNKQDLIYPNLSYQIIGILFEIWTDIGIGRKEKFYQKAIEQNLKEKGITFERELPVKINYKKEIIGIYYFDFLIENKIVLEIKVRNYFSKKDIARVYSYLKAESIKLGIIAHFTSSGVKFKRVVNLR